MALAEPVRQQSIDQLKEICAIDDDAALHLLEGANGDVEVAVRRFFQQDNDDVGEYVSDQDDTDYDSEPTYEPSQPSRPSGFLDWIRTIISIPVRLIAWSIRDLLSFLFSLLGGPNLAVADPQADVNSFVTDFREKYDAEGSIAWLQVPYNNAVNQARRDISFLLVYIHNPHSAESDKFVREYLLSDQFRDFVRQENLLLWGSSIRSSEGYKVAASLREYNTPFVALVCSADGRNVCVLRIAGNFSLSAMMESLQSSVQLNAHYLQAERNERLQRELTNQLRREQEQEYEIALAADRARLQEQRRLENERVEAERLEKELQRQAAEKYEEFVARKDRVAKCVEAEPEPSGDVLRVAVRFPDGNKFDRRFLLDDSLEKLFNVVLVHSSCPDDFTLLCSYPRRTLVCAPAWYAQFSENYEETDRITSFREAGLEGSAVVLVRDNQA